MKTKLLTLLLVVSGSLLAQVTIGIRIGPPPPPRVVYVRPPSPGPEFFWVDGYWYPAGNRYNWHEGYWTRPPYPAARWVMPRYESDRYFEGYWEGDRGRFAHDHRWDRDRERDHHDNGRHLGWRNKDRDRDRDHDHDRQ